MEALFEPIAQYRDVLREKHAEATRGLFEELVAKAGVDAQANARTVAELRRLEGRLADTRKRLGRWKGLHRTLVVAGWVLVIVLVGILLLLLDRKKVRPRVEALEEAAGKLQLARDAKEQEAWAQMAPLNALFDWQMPGQLVARAAPLLQLDPFFTQGRLRDLRRTFGFEENVLGDPEARSLLFSVSGEVNGNPFVLGRAFCREWGMQDYEGTLPISWVVRVPNADGRGTHLETRHQVLRAKVQKPVPTYYDQTFLLFGNEAAPNLRFSREPSALSAEDPESRAGRRHLAAAVKKLEKFSRNLDDDKPFTLMQNHEFEALFGATDRDDEIQFRLLFTPLAQEQMLAILRDRKVGFGDDFTFLKRQKINCLLPDHLKGADLDADPARYQTYELAETRQRFVTFNEGYFHHLFFALAPLLAIPVYQQTRSHESIYGTAGARASAPWEHEAFANHLGYRRFAPAGAATPSILKAREAEGAAGAGDRDVQVVAHAFRAEDRVEQVAVWGGDGRRHQVPVHWKEYLPISAMRTMTFHDAEGSTTPLFEEQKAMPSEPGWANFFRQVGGAAFFRHSIGAALR